MAACIDCGEPTELCIDHAVGIWLCAKCDQKAQEKVDRGENPVQFLMDRNLKHQTRCRKQWDGVYCPSCGFGKVPDDRSRGLYAKYRVERTDGRSATGQKHHNCYLFVLDLTHDPHAIPALQAYVDSCRADYPVLAAELQMVIHQRKGGAL